VLQVSFRHPGGSDMKLNYRSFGIVTTCLLVTIIFITSVVTAGRYEEDFTTKQFCDTLSTTALWDATAGEIKLHPFAPSLVGSYFLPLSYNVVISGHYAYVAGVETGLHVVDISDPANLVLAGNYDTPGGAWRLAISGDYAYVADWDSGLVVVDISDPSNPAYAGSYPPETQTLGVAVSGDYGYVTDAFMGLQVIDISDPTSPLFAGSYDTPGNAEGVTVSGDHVYVADRASGLQVIDISDPTNPSLAGSCDTPGMARCVVTSGDFAYVADYDSGLVVIDISDPTSPSIAGRYDTPDRAYTVALSGDRAYVGDDASGFHVIDISDPTSPFRTGGYPLSDAFGVAVTGRYACVGYGSYLRTIKIADPRPPSYAGSYATPGEAYAVAMAGDRAYVASYSAGLQVIDISDPRNPSSVGSYNTPGAAWDVAISGDYAYVADDASGLQVVDISDPTVPSLAGSYDTPQYVRGVAISGDYAYVADASAGLKVIDISNPTVPSLAGSYDTPDFSYSVAVSGNYAYVADDEAGLQVIDISDPTSPAFAGSYNTPGDARGLTIWGDYVYIADSSSGILVIDISDPTNPSLAGSYDTPGVCRGVAISGDRAYAGDGYNGVQVLDISNPTSPSLVGSYNTPGYAHRIAIWGEYAYVADRSSGLQVIEVDWRTYDLASDVVRSFGVDDTGDIISGARLSSVQSDSVTWEISADGGSHWQDVQPGASWGKIGFPGSDLLWRSTHTYAGDMVNPACSYLEIEWMDSFAVIDSIVDVPNDQGGKVRITWTRSTYDYAGSVTPIMEYAIYRKIDHGLNSPVSNERKGGKDPHMSAEGKEAPAYPPGDWDYVTTVPAAQEDSYSVLVPTLADSTTTDGVYYSTYFLRAWTDTVWVYFDSEPDSGYSVDNLSPHVPASFVVAYNTGSGNDLSWDECPDADFQYFRVYRDESEDFTPSEGNYVHGTTGTDWNDTAADGWKYYYKITAVDFSGNESNAASPETSTDVSAPTLPTEFALYQNVPNPFNPTTVISYDVPEGGGRVTLRIYDVAGRLVRTLVNGVETPGEKRVTWNGQNDHGSRVATGVYLYFMTAPGFEMTKKMVLLR
jgi:hypothetical protein